MWTVECGLCCDVGRGSNLVCVRGPVQCSGQRGEGPVQLRPRTEEDASTGYNGRELICFYKTHQDSEFLREGEK